MAIHDQPDIPCWSSRHRPEDAPQAIAVVIGSDSAVNAWSPRCQPCVDQLADLRDTLALVAYLDPTRQRRPNPDHHAIGHHYGTHNYGTPNYDRPDPGPWRPDPTAWTDPAL